MTTPETLVLVDVREGHRFDVAALERYLTPRIAEFTPPVQVCQFLGGQSNPTYHLTAGDRQYVLRRKPPGPLLPSAHAVDREYRVITALRGKMRRIVWLTTDFPEPASPTSATDERGRTRNETPVTARINPPGATKRT